MPVSEIIRGNNDYRRQYLEAVDLHIDKATYYVENRVPIEIGIARNIKYFDSLKSKK